MPTCWFNTPLRIYVLDGNRIGNLSLRREFSFFASLTSQGLLYEAKQQQTRNKTFASLHWRNLLPHKVNAKHQRTLTHTHHQRTSDDPSDGPSDGTLSDSPPQNKSKKSLRTLTLILEVRTLIAKAIWGKDPSAWLCLEWCTGWCYLLEQCVDWSLEALQTGSQVGLPKVTTYHEHLSYQPVLKVINRVLLVELSTRYFGFTTVWTVSTFPIPDSRGPIP